MLVAHILFRFDTGGLEQIVLATVRDEREGVRHAVICLTDASHEYRTRLPSSVTLHVLDKQPGNDPRVLLRLGSLLRQLRPGAVQTYNLPCLELQFVAALCRVPLRLHAEHGRSAADPLGLNPRYRLLRRTARAVVHRWIVVSADLERWMHEVVGVAEDDVVLVRNGVDTDRFAPSGAREREAARDLLPEAVKGDAVLVGSIGRLDPVKNQAWLLDTWAKLRRTHPDLMDGYRLVLIGGGALETALRERAARLELDDVAWLAGSRHDVEALLPAFDLFVLPSIAEGIPMTVLEAMACEIPVLASRVGGLPEVVTPECGELFETNDADGLRAGLVRFARSEERRRCGVAARRRIESHFSERRMLDAYAELYACADRARSARTGA